MRIAEKGKQASSRRKFFRDAAAGIAGAAVLGSLSCSQGNPPVSEAPKAEPKSHAMTREEFWEYVACFNRKGLYAFFSAGMMIPIHQPFGRKSKSDGA